MWSTFIATVVAAAVGLSLLNVAFEMSRVRDAQTLAGSTDGGAPPQRASAPAIEAPQTSDPGA
jgi:hypothetical protein